MMTEAQVQRLVPIAQKLSIFQRLTAKQILRLLQICRFHHYETGQVVYRRGDSADEMFILVQGTLSVLSPAGKELAEVTAGMTIGEMGLFTQHPRSADVVAKQPASGLKILKPELDNLLKLNREMWLDVLENVVGMMADRLREMNVKLERAGDTVDHLSDQIEDMIGKPRTPDQVEAEQASDRSTSEKEV